MKKFNDLKNAMSNISVLENSMDGFLRVFFETATGELTKTNIMAMKVKVKSTVHLLWKLTKDAIWSRHPSTTFMRTSLTIGNGRESVQARQAHQTFTGAPRKILLQEGSKNKYAPTLATRNFKWVTGAVFIESKWQADTSMVPLFVLGYRNHKNLLIGTYEALSKSKNNAPKPFNCQDKINGML